MLLKLYRAVMTRFLGVSFVIVKMKIVLTFVGAAHCGRPIQEPAEGLPYGNWVSLLYR
jgi:hypothetical protein